MKSRIMYIELRLMKMFVRSTSLGTGFSIAKIYDGIPTLRLRAISFRHCVSLRGITCGAAVTQVNSNHWGSRLSWVAGFYIKTLVLILLTSLTYLQPSYRASSTVRCMIEPKSVKVALKQSAAVFFGEVLEMRNGGNYIEARFRVERSWKGVEAEEVSVLADSTTESPHYRVGQKYLVFAGTRDGKLFTGNCSRTKRLEYAEEDLKQLGAGKNHSKPE